VRRGCFSGVLVLFPARAWLVGSVRLLYALPVVVAVCPFLLAGVNGALGFGWIAW